MMNKRFSPVTFVLLISSSLSFGQDRALPPVALLSPLTPHPQKPASPLQLWYAQPAQHWEETLPLGNGHLGMTPDGGIAKEKIS